MDTTALIKEISARASEKEITLVAIDGPCASGKSTLSQTLEKMLDATVIHADDFFLPPKKRTSERMAEVGGNIDYERLYSEVIVPLLEGKTEFVYNKFSCHDFTFTPVEPKKSKIYIVEGSYSTHPYFKNAYDITVFLQIDEEEKRRRILRRNGDNADKFFSLWIPKENAYFEKFAVKDKCDFVLNQGDLLCY